MKIKSIDNLSLEELKEIIDNNYYAFYNVQESEIRARYNMMLEKEKLINPVFITKDEFLRRNPKYNEVIGHGLFGKEKRRNSEMLDFYDVEDTDREHRIVRSACSKMTVYRFYGNIISKFRILCTLSNNMGYDCIKYLGEGCYYITIGKDKLVVNVLDYKNPCVLVTTGIGKIKDIRIINNNIIEIENKKGEIRRMTTRGFKVDD